MEGKSQQPADVFVVGSTTLGEITKSNYGTRST
jgi:hypothetical protein